MIQDVLIQLAMETIAIASYSVLINEEPKGFINPSCMGYKARGPSMFISLFILCRRFIHPLEKSRGDKSDKGDQV